MPLTFWLWPSSTRGAPPSSGHRRMLWSQDAEASSLPSGDTAKPAIGPLWLSSTLSGSGLPVVQIAICASAPAVAMRPSLSQATAFTALSWKRITCSATLRVSDQRIAEVSKLPDTAWLPSGETASARTGPPWPRNCAWAADASAANNSTTQNRLLIRWFHPERRNARACRGFAQGREEGPRRRPLHAAFNQQEIVMFRRQRQEAEAVELGHRLDGDAPVGASLRDRGSHRIVRLRLVGVAGRP